MLPHDVECLFLIRGVMEWFRKRQGIILALPAILLILIFKVYPLVSGVFLSFTSSPKGVGTNEFVGLQNYFRLFNDEVFLNSLLNIVKAVLVIPIFVIVPLLIAFIIHKRFFGWSFFRATYFFPYLLPPVMVGFMFGFVLGPNGPVNIILRSIGFDALALNWFGNHNVALFSILGVILWSWFGLGTITYLASMGAIPEELYESAILDGAKPMQMLWFITIPSIIPTIGYWAVLVTTSFFIGLFPYIYALTEGGPGYATMMPEYYVYLVSTRYLDSGYASAIGFILFIFIFILAMIQIRFMYLGSQDDV
jgi:raffinose/stachyose/melibiose transport system permease protein